jgi:vacuolar-type H+-ATPase subunit H
VSSDKTVRRREIEDSTAARLAEIVTAAEKAAKQVIDEAEEEARARLVDAREEADRIVAERLAGLAELTDEISAQAEALRRQSELLQRALAEAKAELGGADSLAGSARPGRRAADPDSDRDAGQPIGPSLTVVGGVEREPASEREMAPEREGAPARGREPEAAPQFADAAAGRSQEFDSNGSPAVDTPAGARLLATQMAVSGSSRAEIEARLRDGFAITDTGAILDAILGPEQ